MGPDGGVLDDGETAHAGVLIEDVDKVVGQLGSCQDPQVQHLPSVRRPQALMSMSTDLVAAGVNRIRDPVGARAHTAPNTARTIDNGK